MTAGADFYHHGVVEVVGVRQPVIGVVGVRQPVVEVVGVHQPVVGVVGGRQPVVEVVGVCQPVVGVGEVRQPVVEVAGVRQPVVGVGGHQPVVGVVEVHQFLHSCPSHHCALPLCYNLLSQLPAHCEGPKQHLLNVLLTMYEQSVNQPPRNKASLDIMQNHPLHRKHV